PSTLRWLTRSLTSRSGGRSCGCCIAGTSGFGSEGSRRGEPRQRRCVPLAAQLVVRVERRDLVALGQRRVVEHRPEEVIDPPAETQHRLPDVDQLGRARADRVNAEQPPVLTMEEHLEEPAVVAEDLAARDLSIACEP